jgi:histone H3/H4
MTSEVINVGNAVRNQAYYITGKERKTIHTLKVQADAIQEEISFLMARIECDLSVASQFAYNAGRSTVMVDDIVQANGVTTKRKGEIRQEMTKDDDEDAKD